MPSSTTPSEPCSPAASAKVRKRNEYRVTPNSRNRRATPAASGTVRESFGCRKAPRAWICTLPTMVSCRLRIIELCTPSLNPHRNSSAESPSATAAMVSRLRRAWRSTFRQAITQIIADASASDWRG